MRHQPPLMQLPAASAQAGLGGIMRQCERLSSGVASKMAGGAAREAGERWHPASNSGRRNRIALMYIGSRRPPAAGNSASSSRLKRKHQSRAAPRRAEHRRHGAARRAAQAAYDIARSEILASILPRHWYSVGRRRLRQSRGR